MKTFSFLALGVLLVFSLCNLAGCGSGGGSVSYGGTDPKGDFIIVTIDRDAGTVLHENVTTGETNGPFSFVQETDVADNGGFSIIYRVDLPVSAGGGYVLFAEYPSAAVVYQKFDDLGESDGDPVYAVYRQEVDKTSMYGKAYNWMKFFIDETGAEDDMECGFAAFDDEAHNGLMYGASYSHRREYEGSVVGEGFGSINESGTASVDAMTYDPDTTANVIWQGSVGDWDSAISIVGTPSGASVLDFGPDTGGGGGLVIPQTDAVDNAATWWNTVGGTYFMLVYETDLSGSFKSVQPMKAVIDSGNLKVYQFGDSTETGIPVFDQDFVDVEHTTGPDDSTLVSEYFADVSGNAAASSTVVQNANKAKGAFIAREDTLDGTNLIMTIFDPEGRFIGFTGFFNGDSEEIIRFGFGIRDSDYSNSGL